MPSITTELTQLEDLYRRGGLKQHEYAEAKAIILKTHAATPTGLSPESQAAVSAVSRADVAESAPTMAALDNTKYESWRTDVGETLHGGTQTMHSPASQADVAHPHLQQAVSSTIAPVALPTTLGAVQEWTKAQEELALKMEFQHQKAFRIAIAAYVFAGVALCFTPMWFVGVILLGGGALAGLMQAKRIGFFKRMFR